MDDGRDEGSCDDELTTSGNPLIREWPLETAHLQKGDRIPASEIERGWETKRTDRNYGLRLMAAGEFVTMRLSERALIVVVVSDHDDLVILADADAATYTKRQFEIGIKKMGTSLRRQATVDRAQLTPEQVEAHDQALTRHGAIYAATKKARRQSYALTPSVRQTPGLPEGSGK